MKLKPILFLLIVVLLCLFCTALFVDIDPEFTAFDIPLMENADEKHQGVSENGNVHYLSYSVRTAYPARGVSDFYSDYFIKHGWAHSDKFWTGGWTRIIKSDANGKEYYSTYWMRTWEHLGLSISVNQILEYRHKGEDPGEELHVYFQSHSTQIHVALVRYIQNLIK